MADREALTRESARKRDARLRTLVLNDRDGRLEPPSPEWYDTLRRSADSTPTPVGDSGYSLWVQTTRPGWDVARV